MTDKENTLAPTEKTVMTKYGIIRERIDYYHVGTFRYTPLKDAIAQAKRCSNLSPA